MIRRKCSKCKEIKNITEFYKRYKHTETGKIVAGYRNICMQCTKLKAFDKQKTHLKTRKEVIGEPSKFPILIDIDFSESAKPSSQQRLLAGVLYKKQWTKEQLARILHDSEMNIERWLNARARIPENTLCLLVQLALVPRGIRL